MSGNTNKGILPITKKFPLSEEFVLFYSLFRCYTRNRMDLKFSRGFKIFITLFCFAVASVGFIMKLPSQFRQYDKELHAAFYFLAAAFLNLLFVGRKLGRHIIVFVFLFLFGAGMEWAQEFSKKKFNIAHGRFDPEDLQFNTYGLIAFSVVWILYVIAFFLFKTNQKEDASLNVKR